MVRGKTTALAGVNFASNVPEMFLSGVDTGFSKGGGGGGKVG